MIRSFFIVILILMVQSLIAQQSDPEYWRAAGYRAKVIGDYKTATDNYLQILVIDSTDYDACLALGRLYTLQGEYTTAIHYYKMIYDNDSTDVEALNGMGHCHMYMGNNKMATICFEKAVHYLPGNAQQYFYLARIYSYSGKIDDAISAYNEINKIDDTYAEAWAGIAKMNYWKGKPKTAINFYERAVELDPQNKTIISEYERVEKELNFALKVKFSPLKEIEETYEIVAMISSINLGKRINDHFRIDANTMLDRSSRVFFNHIGDTNRWYDASWVKGSYISQHHTVSGYFGYSFSDNLASTYGISWNLNYSFGKFSFKNSLTAGYDYFYYWNKVGGKAVTNKLDLGYGKITFSAFYRYGIVDPVLVNDIVTDTYDTIENPYNAYSLSVACKILKKPVMKIGVSYSYLDYKYKSPLYYTPFDRHLIGAYASVYYQIKKFYLWGRFAYNIGTEVYYEEKQGDNGSGNGNNQGKKSFNKVTVNVNNWSTSLEMGYNLNPVSLSIGGSNFYNPFYQNITAFASIKVLF